MQDNKKHGRRVAAACVTFLCFLLAFLKFGFLLMIDYTGADTIVSTDNLLIDVIVTTVAVIFYGCILVYASFVSWMLFAKIFFTRSEVEEVLNSGPKSRFECWLLNKLFPK